MSDKNISVADAKSGITVSSLSLDLTAELHARPFPQIAAPAHIGFLATKSKIQKTGRNRQVDFDHLCALLARYDVAPPPAGAIHFSAAIGDAQLKWESHTEFVTYTIIRPGPGPRDFSAAALDVLPADWMAGIPGEMLASVLIHVEQQDSVDEDITVRLKDWFDDDSLAASQVVDGVAVMATDFRSDDRGHRRIAVFARPNAGVRRIGRIVQRLAEMEIYRSMSMLGFFRARKIAADIDPIEAKLGNLVRDIRGGERRSDERLAALLSISEKIEALVARGSYRFGATAAYDDIVAQRLAVLREERWENAPTFREFLHRRYRPSMRTVKAVEERLRAMSARANRAGDLLRTQVEVARSAQNQALMESMDRRAELQLRLQHTVEGLSVVAISYYAVSLLGYVVAPLTSLMGLGYKGTLAALTPVVILCVWQAMKRIRRQI